MKAMRGRIALQRHFVRNTLESFCFFAQAFGVRTRPHVGFLAYDPNESLGSEKLNQLAALLQAKRFEGGIDVFEMNVERTKIIDLG